MKQPVLNGARFPRMRRRREGGQVLLVVLMAIVILCIAALWLADIHHIILSKDKTQNAGDAAALEASRWQGTTLNLMGELNLLHVLALARGDFAACDVITNAQARIAFAGPLTGAAAAQQAAKLNGAPVNDEFTEFVRECAEQARSDYGAIIDGEQALPEPWPGAWETYGDMLDALADEGIAAGIDNARFYNDPDGAHTLLMESFYRAVRGRDWCWFHHYEPGLLADYTDYTWWPALPERDTDPPSSSEILGLHLRPRALRFSSVLEADTLPPALEAADLPAAPEDAGETNELVHIWYAYDASRWGSWEVMNDPTFPIEGNLREEYDYEGADAVMRVENPVSRLSDQTRTGGNEASDVIAWVGAAKPFGHLQEDGAGAVQPTLTPFVVPAFRDVRLIPLDASSSPDGGAFNLRWRRHVVLHLPAYLENGTSALDAGCRYCQALHIWEQPAFRQRGEQWLSTNSWKCTISPPGNGPGGGSYHAH